MSNSNIQSRRLKLKRQRRGGPVILTLTEDANTVLETIEALLNMRVVVQTTDGQNILDVAEAQIDFAEQGLIVTLPIMLNALNSGTGGNQITGGDGAPNAGTLPAGNYVTGVNPSVYIDEENDAIYFCSTPGTAATSQWTQISGGGTLAQRFTTVSVFGDYFVGQSQAGAQSNIAKPYNLRRSLGSETFDGVTVDYNWTIDSDGTGNFRTASLQSGASSETQVLIPRYKPSSLDTNSDTVFAVPCTTTGVSNCSWLEIKPARMFCLQNNSVIS